LIPFETLQESNDNQAPCHSTGINKFTAGLITERMIRDMLH